MYAGIWYYRVRDSNQFTVPQEESYGRSPQQAADNEENIEIAIEENNLQGIDHNACINVICNKQTTLRQHIS